MSMAWKLSLSTTPKMALVSLCDWANDDGGSLFPSVAQVAVRVSCSERQAQRVLHALIEGGYLTVAGNSFGGAPGQTRQYRINVRRIEKEAQEADLRRAAELAERAKKSRQFATETGDILSPVTFATRRVTFETETGDICDTRRVTFETETGDAHVTLSPIDPPIEPPYTHRVRPQAAPEPIEQPEQPGSVGQLVASATTPAGLVCKAMRSAGLTDANPSHPTLRALLDVGATEAEFVDAAASAAAKGKGFAYALATVVGRRTEAAAMSDGLHRGALPLPAADVARATVPGPKGRDPVLLRMEAEAAKAVPPSAEIRARMAALSGKKRAGGAQ